MELATIRTDNDFDQFKKDCGTIVDMSWIGGQQYFNTWIWMSNVEKINIEYFDYNQPDDQRFERCIGTESNNMLHDINCDEEHTYICEEL